MEGVKQPFRLRKYKGDPFRPRPKLRIGPKSRRHFPVAQSTGFCIRRARTEHQPGCVNAAKCDQCFRFSLWKERIR